MFVLGHLHRIGNAISEGPRPHTWLVITDKGKKVSQRVREIQGILTC